MTQEEKLKLAQEIRRGMVVDPVVPEGFERYLERVSCTEISVPTSVGNSHVFVLREKGVEGILPLYVNIHGGGFVRPHMERDHLFASRMTCEAGCLTLDLDYRLAPEYPYPTAVNECYEVVRWAIANALQLGIDPERVIIGGHSSGATLAAALLLKANGTKEFCVKLQLLDYPAMDMYTDPGKRTKRSGEVIDVERARAYNSLYVDHPERAREPFASPIFATEDMLKGLPETLLITAGNDSLCFEGEQYAEMLKKAGVPVTTQRFDGCRHGFMTHCRDDYEKGHQLYIAMMRKACK